MADLEIKINRRKRKKGGRSAEPDGSPIYGTRKKEYLARRTQVGLINFYDMGHLKNVGTGIYEDVNCTFNIDPADSTPSMSNSDIQTVRDSVIFAIAEADWAARFRKIDPSDNGALTVGFLNDSTSIPLDETNPSLFTSDGLKLDSAFLSSALLAVYDTGTITMPFTEITFKGPGRNRVTTVYDEEAGDTGQISLAGATDVFLLPRMFFSKYLGHVHNTVPDRYYVMNYFFTVPRRAKYFDPANPIYDPYSLVSNDAFNNDGGPTGGYTIAEAYLNYQKSLYGSRMFTSSDNVTWTAGILADLPQAEMTPPQSGSIIGTMEWITVTGNPAGVGGVTSPDKYLVAVVKRGAGKWYIWSDTV